MIEYPVIQAELLKNIVNINIQLRVTVGEIIW